MERNDLDMVLRGTGDPDGQIALGDIAAIAHSLQELTTRIGRWAAGQRGAGRTRGSAERATRLLLTGIEPGSTRLQLALGEGDVLPLEGGFEGQVSSRLWEVLDGVAAGRRQTWIEPLVAESVRDLVDALRGTAREVEFARDGSTVTFQPDRVDREIWSEPLSSAGGEVMTLVGRLVAVDLLARRFRLRDDVGNSIKLEPVSDVETAGPLVGRRVAATGTAVRDPLGDVRQLADAAVIEAPLPREWTRRTASDWEAIVAAHPGPDPAGVEGFDDEEVDEFVALIRG